jgi:hypothetical protein
MRSFVLQLPFVLAVQFVILTIALVAMPSFPLMATMAFPALKVLGDFPATLLETI